MASQNAPLNELQTNYADSSPWLPRDTTVKLIIKINYEIKSHPSCSSSGAQHMSTISFLDGSMNQDVYSQLLPENDDVHHVTFKTVSNVHHVTFKTVSNVVRSTIRMKQRFPQRHHFSDEDLLGLILNYFVEEPVSFVHYEEQGRSVTNGSLKQTEVKTRTIRDTDHKSLVLKEENSARLVAVHLQSPDSHHEVKINLSLYKSQSLSHQPVTLGIAGTNYYLSVTGDYSNPVLQLEVESPENLKSINSEEMYRFVFYKSGEDFSSRFESASFPGWFIGTSQKEEEEVQIVSQRQDMFTTFMML
ncbi:interleukin-1 beta-like [Protopterus annectens]|uniref:interleukin-1 beta-like n=1 Tax=Protopterus annectens TaxID=7888 RepID=UPI001CFA9B10|nr:interleukin-1 beta-like [Protopterus annectens]